MDNSTFFYLPWFAKKLDYDPYTCKSSMLEERMHLLSTLLALYPFTRIEDLHREFHLAIGYIRQIAHAYGVYKSEEMRSRINKENGNTPQGRRAFFVKCKKKENNH